MPNFDSDFTVMNLDHLICPYFLVGAPYLHLHTFCHSVHPLPYSIFIWSVILFLLRSLCALIASLDRFSLYQLSSSLFISSDPWERSRLTLASLCGIAESREGCDHMQCCKMSGSRWAPIAGRRLLTSAPTLGFFHRKRESYLLNFILLL